MSCFANSCSLTNRPLPSFPTRRSSDLPVSGQRLRISAELTQRNVSRAFAAFAPLHAACLQQVRLAGAVRAVQPHACRRSEEHTSELQSRENLVCRLLLEKKKQQKRLLL